MEGLINFNKPAGRNSTKCVGDVKRLLPRKTKIGHAGTLDPFATGVLLMMVGKATRQCESLMGQPKQYEATVKFGATTATDDIESPEEPVESAKPPAIEAIEAALKGFVGDILQTPPSFSALKIGGKRAYDLARMGKPIQPQPRTVRVYGIELIEYDWPTLRLRIDCGRGTYIRAIARDLGHQLGVGGYLTQLHRTRVGAYSATDAVTLEQIKAMGIEQALQQVMSVES